MWDSVDKKKKTLTKYQTMSAVYPQRVGLTQPLRVKLEGSNKKRNIIRNDVTES